MYTNKIQITINSLNTESLNLYEIFLTQIFIKLKLKYSKASLPTKTKKITLLKSPHVNKSAREQFLIKKYKKIFNIFFDIHENMDAIDTKFLVLNKPKTIKLVISKIRE